MAPKNKLVMTLKSNKYEEVNTHCYIFYVLHQSGLEFFINVLQLVLQAVILNMDLFTCTTESDELLKTKKQHHYTTGTSNC